jgi:hypothetical protein
VTKYPIKIEATPRETATMPAIVEEDSEDAEAEETNEGKVDVEEEVTVVGGLRVGNNVHVLVDWSGVGEAGVLVRAAGGGGVRTGKTDVTRPKASGLVVFGGLAFV